MLGGITKYNQYSAMIKSMGRTPMDMSPNVSFMAKSFVAAKNINPVNKSLYDEFSTFTKGLKDSSKEILETAKKLDSKTKDSMTNPENKKVKTEDLYKETKKLVEDYVGLKKKLEERYKNQNASSARNNMEKLLEKNKDKLEDIGFKKDDEGNYKLDEVEFKKKFEEKPEEIKKEIAKVADEIKKDTKLQKFQKAPQTYFFNRDYFKGSILDGTA